MFNAWNFKTKNLDAAFDYVVTAGLLTLIEEDPKKKESMTFEIKLMNEAIERRIKRNMEKGIDPPKWWKKEI